MPDSAKVIESTPAVVEGQFERNPSLLLQAPRISGGIIAITE
jgi:hypothetical protein